MVETYKELDKKQCVEALLQKDSLIANQEFFITQLKAELAQIKKLIYGSKSERFVPEQNPQQITLDLDLPADKIETAVQENNISYIRKHTSKKEVSTTRMVIPAHIPRIPIVIEPIEDISGLIKIGEEVTEELELEPARFYVNQYIRPKYARANNEGVTIADLPSRVIDKGIPGPGFLATILTDKYMDHLPLYRQLKRYERMGLKLNDSTFSDWVKAAATLLEPLYEELKKQVLSGNYIQTDETPIKVLDRDKKGASHRGFYWVYHNPQKKLVLFDYRQGRGREGPKEILKEYKGFLQTDGYGVYDDFDKGDITQVNCFAHARRMFDEALDNDQQRASQALLYIQELYHIERKARENNFTPQQRYELRQELALPILSQFQLWLKHHLSQVLPKSLIGKAIAYTITRWEKLYRYTTSGILEIDNNLVENAIRPVALGRKNYLFAGSHSAAYRAGMIYSLLASCKNNGIEPYQWLKNTLAILPDYKANQLNQLLPTQK